MTLFGQKKRKVPNVRLLSGGPALGTRIFDPEPEEIPSIGFRREALLPPRICYAPWNTGKHGVPLLLGSSGNFIGGYISGNNEPRLSEISSEECSQLVPYQNHRRAQILENHIRFPAEVSGLGKVTPHGLHSTKLQRPASRRERVGWPDDQDFWYNSRMSEHFSNALADFIAASIKPEVPRNLSFPAVTRQVLEYLHSGIVKSMAHKVADVTTELHDLFAERMHLHVPKHLADFDRFRQSMGAFFAASLQNTMDGQNRLSICSSIEQFPRLCLVEGVQGLVDDIDNFSEMGDAPSVDVEHVANSRRLMTSVPGYLALQFDDVRFSASDYLQPLAAESAMEEAMSRLTTRPSSMIFLSVPMSENVAESNSEDWDYAALFVAYLNEEDSADNDGNEVDQNKNNVESTVETNVVVCDDNKIVEIENCDDQPDVTPTEPGYDTNAGAEFATAEFATTEFPESHSPDFNTLHKSLLLPVLPEPYCLVFPESSTVNGELVNTSFAKFSDATHESAYRPLTPITEESRSQFTSCTASITCEPSPKPESIKSAVSNDIKLSALNDISNAASASSSPSNESMDMAQGSSQDRGQTLVRKDRPLSKVSDSSVEVFLVNDATKVQDMPARRALAISSETAEPWRKTKLFLLKFEGSKEFTPTSQPTVIRCVNLPHARISGLHGAVEPYENNASTATGQRRYFERISDSYHRAMARLFDMALDRILPKT
ncbi:hypothetical protein METSCH_A07570 [Metschnikowia aff. pulcherrima]|uniref:Uncharacterized protein n=1 Tax=Metschnikowia aff. pulcherrima TaxID=2163413 RepID=A0A4P6XKC8_9ASCO|nr:hypothetical protein METSCH_A07570 [Metschnikowia aff. pulcherrima]